MEERLLVLNMFDPASARREVDLFATEPVPFEELHAAASILRIADVDVRVASRQHLIAMMRAVGRPRDLDDVAALEALDDG